MKKTIFKRVTSALISAVVASGSMMIPSSIPASFAASELEKSLANDSGLDIDFARALQYSIYFYDANMCGTGVSENNFLYKNYNSVYCFSCNRHNSAWCNG